MSGYVGGACTTRPYPFFIHALVGREMEMDGVRDAVKGGQRGAWVALSNAWPRGSYG